MKKLLLLLICLSIGFGSFAQSNTKQYLANEINELLFSNVDSNLNEILNLDKQGTLNIMFKAIDENIDFNILDITHIEVIDPEGKSPYITLIFHCNRCMHLTSPSFERRAKFESSSFTLPVKYKALGMKMIARICDLKSHIR